ncbi:5739_t:CDS:2 [Diversispora eburnea]|uniref:5739_t:CDS:1 n=1 Tax=Diversispora eburnea TaxID=1213867 RepID=A0A9N8YNB8_9GLOM|nr:5739_t:CDS:2 [Diversispora eburnea]
MLKGSTSASYFPDEFLAGVCTALSTPSDLEALKQMFTPRLYDRFVTELEKISSEKSSITIEISKIYNSKIHDIWVNVGSQRATQKRFSDDKEIQRNYLIIHWMTIRIGIQRGDEKESYAERKAKVSKAFSDGIGFKVDVNFDADIIYSLKSSENQQLIYDQVRRPLIVRFESPYFEPSNKIFKKITSNEAGNEEEDSVMNWNWQVGDIDYLLEKEDLESEEKLET